MGVNIHEDRMIARMEDEHRARYGESAQTTSTRETLRKLGQKSDYYRRAFQKFIKEHGEAPNSI